MGKKNRVFVLPTEQLTDLLLCIKSYNQHDGTYAEHSDIKDNLTIGVGIYADKEFYKHQNIYITNDEEIKNCNCYVINVVGDIKRRSVFKPILVNDDIVRKESLITYPNGGWCEKVIMTTDKELIADGVQAIPNEFIEWLIKNQSCKEVETEILDVDDSIWESYFKKYGTYPKYPYYEKIIMPKQEYQEVELSSYNDVEVYDILQKLRLEMKSGVLKWQDDYEFDLEEWFSKNKKK